MSIPWSTWCTECSGSICKEEIGALVVTMWVIFNVFTFHKVACIILSQNKS